MKFSIYLLLISFSIQALAQNLNTPSVSANVLFLYRNSNFHKENTDIVNPDQQRNGINVREAEVQFYSDVDPYTRLSLLLSLHSNYDVNAGVVEEKWSIEPEEGFVESNAVSDVTLKVGKFKAAMGKHNLLHTHAYAFIEAPLANVNLLGDEGLSDVGVSGAILLPASWFSEVTLQYLRGEGENAEFSSPTPGDGVGLVHWKNLFDLSEDLTMELGGSYASGANALGGNTALSGADLTLKWRPADGGRYQSLLWAVEYLGREQTQPTLSNEIAHGVATWFQYQFAEQWAGLYRYDNLTAIDTSTRNSIGAVYMPSEFSSFKFEIDQRSGGVASTTGEKTENTFYIQGNFTIGAHPAHSY